MSDRDGGEETDLDIDSAIVFPPLTVIVHGTWANNDTWWRWPAEFPQYINQHTGDVYDGQRPFTWSGDNTDEARREGGRTLLRWAQENPAQNLTIIAHSHGGNVVFLASQIGLKIQKLILMGTPIRTDYLPNMEEIKTIFNIYSTRDFVQILGAIPAERDNGRILPEATENIHVETNSVFDPHSELRTVSLWEKCHLERILRES